MLRCRLGRRCGVPEEGRRALLMPPPSWRPLPATLGAAPTGWKLGGPKPATEVTTGTKGGGDGDPEAHKLSLRARLLLCNCRTCWLASASRLSRYAAAAARFLLSLSACMTLSVEHGSCFSASPLIAGRLNELVVLGDEANGKILTLTGAITSGDVNGFAKGRADFVRQTVG